MVRKSEAYAKTLLEKYDSTRERIQAMFRQTLLRDPTDDEFRWMEEMVETSSSNDRLGVWADACQALWNTSEFLYVE
jgi:cell fate (sporulation/competence/biofilm development) regulator YlbF (YheA/YmcA/DUF963 family)